MRKTSTFVAASVLVGILLLGVWGCNIGSTDTPSSSQTGASSAIIGGQQTGLWVSGQGKVNAPPDVVNLQLGVESQESTVALAQAKARDVMNKIQGVLTSKGVADKDIQTVQFTVAPVTQFIQKENRQQIIGYKVSNLVSVKIRKLDQTGPIIDAVAEAGGDLTRIQNITYTIDDPTALMAQAREKAVNDAQAKATQLAKLAKVTLGKPTYVSESGYVPQPPPRVFMAGAAVAAEAAAPTPISPGELQIQSTVQVVFAIQ